jgi:hypothetical protein
MKRKEVDIDREEIVTDAYREDEKEKRQKIAKRCICSFTARRQVLKIEKKCIL